MKNYLDAFSREDKTDETFDKENWLLTGDIGRKDVDGFFYITGTYDTTSTVRSTLSGHYVRKSFNI